MTTRQERLQRQVQRELDKGDGDLDTRIARYRRRNTLLLAVAGFAAAVHLVSLAVAGASPVGSPLLLAGLLLVIVRMRRRALEGWLAARVTAPVTAADPAAG